MVTMIRQIVAVNLLLYLAPITTTLLSCLCGRLLEPYGVPVPLGVSMLGEVLWPVFAVAASWRALHIDTQIPGRERWSWRGLVLISALVAGGIVAYAGVGFKVFMGAIGPLALGLLGRGRRWTWRLPASLFSTALLVSCVVRGLPWLATIAVHDYRSSAWSPDSAHPLTEYTMRSIAKSESLILASRSHHAENLTKKPVVGWRYFTMDDGRLCDPRNYALRMLERHNYRQGVPWWHKNSWSAWVQSARVNTDGGCAAYLSDESILHEDIVEDMFWPAALQALRASVEFTTPLTEYETRWWEFWLGPTHEPSSFHPSVFLRLTRRLQ